MEQREKIKNFQVIYFMCDVEFMFKLYSAKSAVSSKRCELMLII